jgi:2'-5' RNA ligase
MRLFTGLAIPPEATAALTALVNQLRPLADLRWTRPEKLHVTLTFIGEWPEPRLGEMRTALSQVQADGPIPVALRGLGWMPNPRFPRALYTGVEAAPGLHALAAATGRAVEGLGVSLEDRVYRPHVTLARVRGRPPLDRLALHPNPITSFEASSFCLYLSSEGKYTKLEEFRF